MTSISTVRPIIPGSADTATPTRIDITPEASEQAFFGTDGPSFGDLVDVINPLNHIPFLSDLVGEKEEEKPAVASRLAGGLLFGGPIGFVASLMNEVFREATGASFAGAVVAALSGEELPGATQIQVAEAETASPTAADDMIAQTAMVDEVEVSNLDDATHALSAARTADITREAQMGSASKDAKVAARNRAMLDLYGNSASASTAYQKAQFTPFLKEASGTNQVL